MFWIIYLLVGTLVAGLALKALWHKVSSGQQRRRLVALCALALLAWPGVLLFAWADKSRTRLDYISQWLVKDKNSVSE